MKYKLAFIGFGTVGQGLADLLGEKRAFLKERYGFEYEVVVISDFLKGSVYNPAGLGFLKYKYLIMLFQDRPDKYRPNAPWPICLPFYNRILLHET